jgi:hypothetical protein
MPMIIDHIDAIARKLQRDVLCVTFTPQNSEDDLSNRNRYNWKEDKLRQTICNWLTEQNISWKPCQHFANEDFMSRYQGQIYLDVPYDETDPLYILVRDYLENPDGSMRYRTVGFWHLLLEQAMINVHHDEPGFWEKRAENY